MVVVTTESVGRGAVPTTVRGVVLTTVCGAVLTTVGVVLTTVRGAVLTTVVTGRGHTFCLISMQQHPRMHARHNTPKVEPTIRPMTLAAVPTE